MTALPLHSRDLILHQEPFLPDSIAKLPRLRLANLPTPIQEMRRLSEALEGPSLYIKRDDLTGLATGGNKTRKLEFLVADALKHEADCLLTAGGPQSNHCRQTAAAAARCGLESHLILSGTAPTRLEGNLLLDQILGANIHWAKERLRNELMTELAGELEAAGGRPYVIPVGGSNRIGALGYAVAFLELQDQLKTADLTFDTIVFATSSGGTQAGLLLGAALADFTGRVLGISIDQAPDGESSFRYKEFVRDIANEAAEDLNLSIRFSADDIAINYDFLGQGYGVVGDLERDALRMLARTEGILAGPVYTGRAVGGLIELIRREKFRSAENVLFWHTGDESTIHAYGHALGICRT